MPSTPTDPMGARATTQPTTPPIGAFVERPDATALLTLLQTSARTSGVVHLDLDRFHQVNTQWGHDTGDLVLFELGPRLAACLPREAVVCSTDGDSFVAIVPDADWAHTTSIAEQMLQAIARPVELDNGELIAVRASAGIAWKAEHDSPIDLLEHAFLACRRAKATAPGTVVGYEYSLGEQAVRQKRIDDGLRRAIELDELRLFVQPEIDLRDGRVVGVEALVRWQHPTDGLLAPGAFLPDAEAAGLMNMLGAWVLDTAIDLAERWRTLRDGEPMRVWVNLAAQQLTDGDEVHRKVQHAIDTGRITSRSIGFEVTESSLLDDLAAATGSLTALRQLGFEIALDDFGTGYSSLSYLRRLPVTAVKIDRSFVQGIGDSLADEAIIEAVVDLSHALGLRVIAEGIEDVQQATALMRLGADHAQGYHFGRPLPPEELESRLCLAWCGADAPSLDLDPMVHRADELPGFGSPRARLLMATLDSVHDSVVVTAASGGDASGLPIVYVNDAFEAETGLRSRDVLGRTMASLLPDDLSDEVSAEVLGWFDDVHQADEAATREIPSRRADGTAFLCEVTISPINDERGVRTHWLHVRRDLSQRRAAENERRRFQGLIEQTTSLVFLVERGGRLSYANVAMRRALGIDLDQALDDIELSEVFSAEQQNQLDDVILPALRSDRVWQGESTFVNRRTGLHTDVVADVQYVDDPLRPGVRFFAAVCRDVTDENRALLAAQRRRALGEFAARVAQVSLDQTREQFLVGLDVLMSDLGELIGSDFAFLDLIDVEQNVLRPLGVWRSAVPPLRDLPPSEVSLDLLPNWIAHLTQVSGVTNSWRVGDAPWSRDLRTAFPGDQGGSALIAPLRVGGVLLGVLGLASNDEHRPWDELEREMVQQLAETLANLLARLRDGDRLQASQTRLGAMLASVRDVLLVIDGEGWIRYVNQSSHTALGYQPENMVDRHFLDFVYAHDRELAMDAFMQAVAGTPNSMLEVRVVHADGSWSWFDVDASDFDPVVGGYMISLRDVTLRHQNEAAAHRRAELERVVLTVSQWALEVRSEDMCSELNDHLQLLGRTLGTDTAFASLLEGDHIRNIAGWSKAGSPQAYEIPERPDGLPAIAARYRTLEPLVVDDIDDIDDFEDDWVDEWRRFPIADRAGLSVPLVSGGRCLGILGVAMASNPRSWSAEEIALVKRIAETVAALLAQLQIEDSLRKGEARLSALLNASHDVVVVVDGDGKVWYANGAVRRSLGYRPAELVGRNVAEFLAEEDIDLAVRRLSEIAADKRTPITLIKVRAADGSVRSWEITSGVRRDPVSGGRVLTCRDVTSRLTDEAEASRWVGLLRFAFDVAQHALDVDAAQFIDHLPKLCADIASLLDADYVYVDQMDETRRELVALAGWQQATGLATMHAGQSVAFSEIPAWLGRLRRGGPVVVEDASRCDEHWAVEKRCVMGPEGGLLAVSMLSAGELMGVVGMSMRDTARVWHDDEVTFLRIVAETVAHVMERARLDEALRTSEARFRLLSETAADMVLLVGFDGLLKYVSPSSVELLGIAPSDLIGTPAVDGIHPDDRKLGFDNIPRILKHGFASSEMRLRRADGTYVWVANSTSAVRDPETGQPIEFRASVRDISDRKRLEAELEHQALHDPLTGLANRILLQRRLDHSLRRGEPGRGPLSVLLLDLDGFKEVNDEHGHAIGDEVLRVIGARLRQLTRGTDTLSRTGGDEFVVLCPSTTEEEAVAIAERIVETVQRPLRIGSIIVRIGVSVGVANRRDVGGDEDSDALLIEADRAMYTAKRTGSCRVAVGPDRVVL